MTFPVSSGPDDLSNVDDCPCHVVTINLSKKQIASLKERVVHNIVKQHLNKKNLDKSTHDENEPSDSHNLIIKSPLHIDSVNLYREKLKQHSYKDYLNSQPKKNENLKEPRNDINMEDKSNLGVRTCGCMKTSEKLKELLKRFPSPPPPTPISPASEIMNNNPGLDLTALCSAPVMCSPSAPVMSSSEHKELKFRESQKSSAVDLSTLQSRVTKRLWRLSSDMLQVLQLSLTTTAIALYYIVYCYMQVVYYTLISAMFFHNADGPMKITIGVVTVTSLIVGFNLLLRMEKYVGITINE